MNDAGIAQAARSTFAGLFRARARVHPHRRAIVEEDWVCTYADLDMRTDRLAATRRGAGVRPGDRVAVLSENRAESLEVFIAAAKVGAIVACPELAARRARARPLPGARRAEARVRIGPIRGSTAGPRGRAVRSRVRGRARVCGARSGRRGRRSRVALLILYTSWTTGLPKGAVISHRAQIVRNLVVRAEYGIASADAFVAWSPMYHMGGTEYSLGTLMSGGTVFVVDGFEPARLAEIVATEVLGWLLLMPGMVAAFVDVLKDRGGRPRGVALCGVVADLVPPEAIAEVTTLLGAPYANTFGATETGNPPCSTNTVPIGVVPTRLSKEVSPYCEVRLVDANGRDVADGDDLRERARGVAGSGGGGGARGRQRVRGHGRGMGGVVGRDRGR